MISRSPLLVRLLLPKPQSTLLLLFHSSSFYFFFLLDQLKRTPKKPHKTRSILCLFLLNFIF
ncbi:unnamed protein product, partial [Prunus brigantina]